MSTTTQLRFKGSLFGLMLGDITGAYFEFSSKGPKDLPSLEELSSKTNIFGMRLGYTDDTILALLAMESFIHENGRFNTSSQWEFARQYIQETTAWSPNGRCFDIGHSTYKSLEHGSWLGKHDASSGGNGVLMRLAPFAYHRARQSSLHDIKSFYQEVADITHGNDITCTTALLMGQILEALYRGDDWVSARSCALAAYPVTSTLDLFRRYSGYCEDSLVLALYLMDNQAPWPEAMQLIIDLGGDTDTNAAVFGQFYGALHPEFILDRVSDVSHAIHRHDELCELIDLFIKKYERSTGSTHLQCDPACVHYGEGCALGYRMDLLRPRNTPKNTQEETALTLLQSKAFKDYWERILRQPAKPGKLACAHLRGHSDCAFEHCDHLRDELFMSPHYVAKRRSRFRSIQKRLFLIDENVSTNITDQPQRIASRVKASSRFTTESLGEIDAIHLIQQRLVEAVKAYPDKTRITLYSNHPAVFTFDWLPVAKALQPKLTFIATSTISKKPAKAAYRVLLGDWQDF